MALVAKAHGMRRVAGRRRGGVEDAREEIILVGSGASAGGDGELEVSLTWLLPYSKGPAAAAHLRCRVVSVGLLPV